MPTKSLCLEECAFSFNMLMMCLKSLVSAQTCLVSSYYENASNSQFCESMSTCHFVKEVCKFSQFLMRRCLVESSCLIVRGNSLFRKQAIKTTVARIDRESVLK